jgi:hypothetical protein
MNEMDGKKPKKSYDNVEMFSWLMVGQNGLF